MRRNKVGMLACDLSIKAVSDTGAFSGYLSVFGNIDRANEIVVPGAFAESLAAFEAAGKSLPMLWQHDQFESIGSFPVVKEDEHGLYVEGQLWLEDAPRAKQAWRGLKERAVTGMSIGYRILEEGRDVATSARLLKKLDLIEGSIVTSPCNPEAQVEAVKFKIAHGDLPTLPEFERFLREAGFSKTVAAVVANRGLAHLHRSESGSAEAEKSAIAALNARLTAILSK